MNKEQLLINVEKRSKKYVFSNDFNKMKIVIDLVSSCPKVLKIVNQMELSGGEPAIIDLGLGYKGITIVDTSPESPMGRRSLCYDLEAFDKRKANKPIGNAIGMANEIGARLLTKEEYLALQKIIPIDQKSSSWLLTPSSIREKGGAIYGERRFGEVLIGANGAESYFSNRGFRLILVIG
ncbi:MAG: DUF4256 domain-containing protein [Bacilli bacterium]